jgi:hypothetical protein
MKPSSISATMPSTVRTIVFGTILETGSRRRGRGILKSMRFHVSIVALVAPVSP